MGNGPQMGCLRESLVLALVGARLDEDEATNVRRHLGACADCRSLVAECARSVTSDLAAPDDDAGPVPSERTFLAHHAPGTTIDGRYRVERILGAGGVAVVLHATDMRLGRQVAIKLLQPRACGREEIVRRFALEAEITASIVSPHVVRVLEVARPRTGDPYIVLERLIGRDLRSLLEERGPMSLQRAADLVAQASLGAGAAHKIGIVHRDLKPANVFVCDPAPAARPLAKVLDFGMSKAIRPALAGSRLVTRASLLGTPLYMPPEQLRAPRDVDARADVWALGTVLYELLTGEAPFRRASLEATCAAIQHEPAPRIGSEVDDVLARCLAKEPDARFTDANALARALAPFAGSDRATSSTDDK